MVELTIFNIVLIIVFGIFIGILGSSMGVGGGAFIVPFFVLVFNIPIKYAIAVSLVSIIATSSAVASVNVERGLTNVRLGIFLEMSMAIGSIVSTFVMMKTNSSIIQLLFSFMLLPVALTMFLKAKKTKKTEHKEISLNLNKDNKNLSTFFDPSLGRNVVYASKKLKTAFFFSFFGGVMSGLFGLGGGIVQVPVMNILCGVPIKAATATSNFMIGLSASASAIILFKNGYILGDIATFLIVGVVIGSIIGMKFLYKAKGSTIQLFFSFLLMFLSLKMIWSVFK
jgi:uncharacterized membrane protein YfcA